jgi:hypothetical protein
MAADAKTTNFMLGVAEVMLGNVNELYDLNPVTHGIGLVKNFTCEATKDRTDLTQGRTNDIVFSMTTSSTTKCNMEVYEYSVSNMAYALGLQGGAVTVASGDALTTTGSVAFSSGSVSLSFADGTGLQTPIVGDYVSLRNPNSENILMGKVSAVTGITAGTASTATMTVDIADLNSTQTIAAGTLVSVVNVLDIGSTDVDYDLSAKVSGQLANGTWVTFLFPKVRITSGLSIAFTTDNFGNIPFEFTPLKASASDPYYAEFKGVAAKILVDSIKAPLA